MSINKVLLENSHAHSFISYLWLLCFTSEFSSCDRDHKVDKVEKFNVQLFTEKVHRFMFFSKARAHPKLLHEPRTFKLMEVEPLSLTTKYFPKQIPF